MYSELVDAMFGLVLNIGLAIVRRRCLLRIADNGLRFRCG